VPSFFAELKAIEDKGLDSTDRIFISDRAHLVFDLHQLVDGLEEVELGAKNIGTTRKGIGPTYSTKASRSGIRVYELFNWPGFEKKLRLLAHGYKRRFGDLLVYDVEEELAKYKVGYLSTWVLVECVGLMVAAAGLLRDITTVRYRCGTLYGQRLQGQQEDTCGGRKRAHARHRLRHVSLRHQL
jgi:adenylosuccinate synthase